MKTHLVLLGAISLATSLTAACDIRDIGNPDDSPRTCTLKYVPDGLTLQVESDSPQGFPDGVYHLAIEADGVSMDVTGEYSNDTLRCSGSGFTCGASVDVDDQETLIVEVELAPWGRTIQLKRLLDGVEDGGPAVIDMALSVDGYEIAAAHYEPEYTVIEPNGPGCGTVTRASDVLYVATSGM